MGRIKVLILSYQYLPLDIISSYRIKGLVDNLYNNDIYATLCTHNWEGNGPEIKKQLKVEKESHCTIIRIPMTREGGIIRLLSHIVKVKCFSKIVTLYLWFVGYLDGDLAQLKSFRSFSKYLDEHLKNNKYDMIIGVFSPHQILKLTARLASRYKCKYAIDCRDPWDNNIMLKDYNPGYKMRIRDLVIKHYWQKWFSGAEFFTIPGKKRMKKIKEITKIRGYVVTHGYDDEIVKNISESISNKFIISHIGTLYNVQRIDMLIEAIKLLEERIDLHEITVYLMGAYRKKEELDSENPFSYHRGLQKYIDRLGLGYVFKYTGRRPRKEAIDLMQSSHILLQPTYPGVYGYLPGKLFEMLGAGKNILAFPDTGDEIEEILSETNAGQVFESVHSLAEAVERYYREWKITGKVMFNGNQEEIDKYSRRAQVEKMASIIKLHIG